MYSQYVDGSFSPVEQNRPQQQTSPPSGAASGKIHRPNALLEELTGGVSRLLGGLEKQLSLRQLDSGDILLVLIILFLFLEGDNLEIVITLALMLLLSLNDD